MVTSFPHYEVWYHTATDNYALTHIFYCGVVSAFQTVMLRVSCKAHAGEFNGLQNTSYLCQYADTVFVSTGFESPCRFKFLSFNIATLFVAQHCKFAVSSVAHVRFMFLSIPVVVFVIIWKHVVLGYNFKKTCTEPFQNNPIDSAVSEQWWERDSVLINSLMKNYTTEKKLNDCQPS